jgi:YD repeat-containing protein
VKTEYGSYENGKLKISTNSESKIITENPGVLKIETLGYFYDRVASKTYYLDSISGIYRFVIVSEYVDQMMAYTGMPGRGMTFHKKTLTRTYVLDSCSYEDKIIYSSVGGVEHITEFASTYQLRDSQGRILEKGELDFFEAYEKYMAAHPTPPNNSMPDIFPLGFVKLFLSGKIQSKRKAIVTYTYNTKGLLIAKTDYGNKYKFKYAENDRLIEFISEGYNTYMINYRYNDKGLVIKMQVTPGKYDGTGQQTVPKDCTYDYAYY